MTDRRTQVRYRVTSRLRRHELTWLALVYRRRAYRRLLVRRTSGIVIDGYFRSANTFAVEAFRSVNPTVRISEHLHSPFQFVRAARFGIPAILLVRQPEDAVSSELVRCPEKLPEASMQEWVHFHERTLAIPDGTVIATFEQVTGDFSAVVERANRKFGRDFRPYRNTPDADAATFDAVDRYFRAGEGALFSTDQFRNAVGRPESARNDEISAARLRVQQGTAASTLRRAQEIYETLEEAATRQIPPTRSPPTRPSAPSGHR